MLDATASKQHALVEPYIRSGFVVYIENVSKNGDALVNDAKVQRHELKHGDVIRMAETVIVIGT